MIVTIQEFLDLRRELPVADVRSEGEYAMGHIPGVTNIPILNNAERIAVGTDYKQKGQAEAIKTGFRLVGPRIIDIVNEAEHLARSGELIVHCWRGGMRSSNFCQFLGMAQIKTHQLRGGYKAYRQEATLSFTHPFPFVVIGGSTGSGKSEILRTLETLGEQVIDLEALANHKGSVFGGLMMPPQPTTEQFQNDLFEKILTLDRDKPIWIEDESFSVGRIFLPEVFWRRMIQRPVIEINVDKDIRINRLVSEYGHADQQQFLSAMERITKKLGGQHFNTAKDKLLQGDMAGTIDILLTYYDKAYDSCLAKNKARKVSSLSWSGEDTAGVARQLVDMLPSIMHR